MDDYDLTCREFADLYGVSTEAARQNLRDAGVPRRRCGRLWLYHRPSAREHFDGVPRSGDAALRRSTMTIAEFAAACGVTRWWAHRLADRHGLPAESVNGRLTLLDRREAEAFATRYVREKRR